MEDYTLPVKDHHLVSGKKTVSFTTAQLYISELDLSRSFVLRFVL